MSQEIILESFLYFSSRGRDFLDMYNQSSRGLCLDMYNESSRFKQTPSATLTLGTRPGNKAGVYFLAARLEHRDTYLRGIIRLRQKFSPLTNWPADYWQHESMAQQQNKSKQS
jgi:hypothetical protein